MTAVEEHRTACPAVPYGYALQTTLGYVQSAAGSTYVVYRRGQVTKAQTAEVTCTYGYKAAHRLTSMLDSNGNRTDYLYDPTGRLTNIWAPNNDVVSFSYDDGGRLTEKWFPNGVNTQYSYNPDNTLRQIINRSSVGTGQQ